MAKLHKRPTIDTHISEREARIDSLWDEVQTFMAQESVNQYDLAACGSCNGDYTAGLAPLTDGNCVPCYAETQGIFLIDVPYSRGKSIVDSKARPHYVHDDGDASFENAVRLYER